MRFLFRHKLLMLAASLFLLAALPKVASSSEPGFVDLDGDGFNDLAPDDDADGIPDEFEFHLFFSTGQASLQTLPMFGVDSEPVKNDDSPKLSPVDRFGQRQFRVRDLTAIRSDFESDFATGLGLGGGLGGGGACAGGICF